jgi:hypothetical protein
MAEKYLHKECVKHGATEHIRRSDTNSYRCKKCRNDATSEKRRRLKLQAIEYLGGKCKKCGYKKCVAALEFHHKNGTKDFAIGEATTKSWDKIKKELDKCILLCANCHREEHHAKRNKKGAGKI